MRLRELRRAPALYCISDVLLRAHHDREYHEQHCSVVVAQSVHEIVVIPEFTETGVAPDTSEDFIQPVKRVLVKANESVRKRTEICGTRTHHDIHAQP